MMKKLAIFASLIGLAAMAVMAQGKESRCPQGKEPQRVEEIVKDLSATQKRKLESISDESRQRMEPLRKERHRLRDSIHALIPMDGDHSKTLYSLIDREAAVGARIAKEMYATKQKMDAVLTPEQRKVMQQAYRQHGNETCCGRADQRCGKASQKCSKQDGRKCRKETVNCRKESKQGKAAKQ